MKQVHLKPADIALDAYRAQSGDAFRQLLRVLPFSLAVREMMRMRALAEAGVIRTPLLDVGCGDGLFWEVVARSYLGGANDLIEGLLGIDLNAHELQIASVRLKDQGGALMIADISGNVEGASLEGLQQRFSTVIANCSLEHVPRLEMALRNIHGFLAPEGTFSLFVPAPHWTDTLRIKQVAERVSHRVGGTVGGVLDGFFQHHHLYPHYVWKHLLTGVGFRNVKVVGLGSARVNRMFEQYLAPAFGAFVFKSLFKRYPAWPGPVPAAEGMSAFVEEVTQGAFLQNDLEHPEIVEYFIRCDR